MLNYGASVLSTAVIGGFCSHTRNMESQNVKNLKVKLMHRSHSCMFYRCKQPTHQAPCVVHTVTHSHTQQVCDCV